MTRILFVCLGNICRSPMAEYVMKDLVQKAGRSAAFFIASAATSDEEVGNPIYSPARRTLEAHEIPYENHPARQMTLADYRQYDLLIGMDASNIRDMRRICGGDPNGKLHLLMDYTDHPHNVADPWFTGNFDAAWKDVLEGCTALFKALSD